MATEQKKQSVEDAMDERDRQIASGSYGDQFFDYKALLDMKSERFVPKDGDNMVLIIHPSQVGYWGRLLCVHFDMGVNRSAFACPEFENRSICPICSEWKKYKDSGQDDAAKPYRYKKIMLYWVIDLSEGAKISPENVKLWPASEYAIDQEIYSRCKKKKPKPGGGVTITKLNPTNPEKPLAISFNKSGKGRGTRYTAFDLVPVEEQIDYSLFSEIPSLDRMITWHDPDHMSQIVRIGVASDGDGGDEEYNGPAVDDGDTKSRLQERIKGYKKPEDNTEDDDIPF